MTKERVFTYLYLCHSILVGVFYLACCVSVRPLESQGKRARAKHATRTLVLSASCSLPIAGALSLLPLYSVLRDPLPLCCLVFAQPNHKSSYFLLASSISIQAYLSLLIITYLEIALFKGIIEKCKWNCQACTNQHTYTLIVHVNSFHYVREINSRTFGFSIFIFNFKLYIGKTSENHFKTRYSSQILIIVSIVIQTDTDVKIMLHVLKLESSKCNLLFVLKKSQKHFGIRTSFILLQRYRYHRQTEIKLFLRITFFQISDTYKHE